MLSLPFERTKSLETAINQFARDDFMDTGDSDGCF